MAAVTIFILVVGLMGLSVGLGSIAIGLWTRAPELLISAPALIAGGVASLLYATIVGIGWELLKRLRELRNGLVDTVVALREVRTLQRGLNAEVSELAASREPQPEPPEVEPTSPIERSDGDQRVSAFLDPEPPHHQPEPSAIYVAEYRRKDGTKGRREVPAPSADAVRRALEERGHTVIDVRARLGGEAEVV